VTVYSMHVDVSPCLEECHQFICILIMIRFSTAGKETNPDSYKSVHCFTLCETIPSKILPRALESI